MTENTLAQQQAEGLRALADMIEQNPELAARFDHTLGFAGINVHFDRSNEDKAGQLAHIARVALRHGATVDKEIDDTWHNLDIRMHGVKLHVLAYRGDVCERVVVGTETVTTTVPDPEKLAEVPQVEVTETVEKYEWQCRPLLASDAS